MKWHATIPLVTILFFGGCSLGKGFINSFKGQPGQRISFPSKEPVYGTTYWIAVRMIPGDLRPWCSLYGADNERTCYFYYDWFTSGLETDPDGYQYLNFPTASGACQIALWSGNPNETSACARALMYQRWLYEDEDIFEEEVY